MRARQAHVHTNGNGSPRFCVLVPRQKNLGASFPVREGPGSRRRAPRAAEGLTSLQTLELSDTKLSTLPPLQGLTSLKTLNLARSTLTTLPSLEGLTALKILDLT